MPKNSWSSWQEAVKSLLEILGKQRVHQMTEGSKVGGGGDADGGEGQEEGEEEERMRGKYIYIHTYYTYYYWIGGFMLLSGSYICSRVSRLSRLSRVSG
jgi:hypothetical protein